MIMNDTHPSTDITCLSFRYAACYHQGMRTHSVGHALAAILASTLAACSGSVNIVPSSDGGTILADGGVTPTPLPTSVDCLSPYDMMAALYARLTPASGIDGISFYAVGTIDLPAPDGGAPPISRGSIGKPCGDAACEAKLAELAASTMNDVNMGSGWTEGVGGMIQARRGFAIVTRAGIHTAVVTLDDLRPLISPIETLQEAQAWATINGKGATCESMNNASTANADYYELRSVSSSCDFSTNITVLSEVIYRVYRDGTIEAGAPRELKRESSGGCAVAGRRPTGLGEHTAEAPSPLGTYLAEMAHLESAAVYAFGELASELERFGAPRSLIERARIAQGDEMRHTLTMSRHAKAQGATLPELQVSPRSYASIFDLALHNAEEGCVRETYGALVAMHQATCAKNESLRSDLTQIAHEEVAHAEWSHDLDAWLQTQLTEAQCQAVREAKTKAFEALHSEATRSVDANVAREVGLPNQHGMALMLASLQQTVLS